jgi:ATP-binding cassette subfamily D (ALD) protein 3
VTAHSEEIAFYGGGQTEKNILNRSFFSILKLSKLHHTLQFFMGILDSYLVKYGASMVAYSM